VDVWSTKPSPEGTLDILETSGEAEHQQITPRKVDIIKTILDDFAGAIINKRKPLVTGEDGVMALRVSQAAVENMEINKTTEMDEFPED
jgi:predicted dehydrogenase